MDSESSATPVHSPGEMGGSGRIMALDPGEKRIGVAITDPLGCMAQPLMTIYRKTPRADLKSIARLIRKHEVRELVVGKPLHMSGDAGPGTKKAEEFAESLRAEIGITVHLHDERLTTWEAHQLLDAGQRSGGAPTRDQRAERKRVVDQVAAALILESFLIGRTELRARDAAPDPDAP
jgi:putative Holliday junction resolvase